MIHGEIAKKERVVALPPTPLQLRILTDRALHKALGHKECCFYYSGRPVTLLMGYIILAQKYGSIDMS